MTDLTPYVNQSQIQTKTYYFDINLHNHRLELSYSQNTWRLINFLLHHYHSDLWSNIIYTIHYFSRSIYPNTFLTALLFTILQNFGLLLFLYPLFQSSQPKYNWLFSYWHLLGDPCSIHLQHERAFCLRLHTINHPHTLINHYNTATQF